MTDTAQDTVTRLLGELRDGQRDNFDEIFPLLYDELRALASRERRAWRGQHSLDTTALVHEAYLKLVDQTHADWQSRAHFEAVAAKAIRYILIDYARRRGAKKRGGDRDRVPLDALHALLEDPKATAQTQRLEAVLALEDALRKLEERSERQCRIVECRFFGGMTVDETATALGVSSATVKRGWSMAQAWLYRELKNVA